MNKKKIFDNNDPVKINAFKSFFAQEVKIIMNILPDFLNHKISYYLQNGIIDKNGANQIVGNFIKYGTLCKRNTLRSLHQVKLEILQPELVKQ